MGEYRDGKWCPTFGDVQAGMADEAPGEGRFSLPDAPCPDCEQQQAKIKRLCDIVETQEDALKEFMAEIERLEAKLTQDPKDARCQLYKATQRWQQEAERLENDAENLRNTITSTHLSLKEQDAEIEELRAGCDRLHGYIAEKSARIAELESAIDVVRTYIQARDAKLRPLDSFPELAPRKYIEMVQAIAALEGRDDE